MGEFFHGWRRKTGIVTLMMALVFAAVWVRSQFVWDSFNFKIGSNRSLVLMSRNNGIVGMSVVDRIEGSVDNPFHVAVKYPTPDYFRPPAPESGGFLFGTSVHQFPVLLALYGSPTVIVMTDGAVMSCIGVPQWGFAVPLTLISFWLLLSKPRNSTPKKIMEPITEKVA